MSTRTFRFQRLCHLALGLLLLLVWYTSASPGSFAESPHPIEQAFGQAARETGVPVELLKAICYMEGRLSNHGGTPSVDSGYGCMHLVRNRRANTLEQAARLSHISEQQLQIDIASNIRGGAYVLREDALQASPTHSLPTELAGWADALALYSGAGTPDIVHMYIDAVYKLLNTGFRARAEHDEEVQLLPQAVQPLLSEGARLKSYAGQALPSVCRKGGTVDYPGAINCIVSAKKFNCNRMAEDKPCNYEGAKRPDDYDISHIVIHDVEGTALDALSVFHNPDRSASAHYIVDTDGTVYQVLREHDVGYHAGNLWYNRHSIGIEHAGYDKNGYLWYNAVEYLASAKLVAYLLDKYNIPLDHDHIISHGMVPSPSTSVGPNHVDPGPFWLWSYYLRLIARQGGGDPTPRDDHANVVTIVPQTSREPAGDDGNETDDNFNFFSLYKGPSIASGPINSRREGEGLTDIASNVEAELSYYYTARKADPDGTGMMMYRIWFGVQDPAAKPARFAHARQVWLAVPEDDAIEGQASGRVLRLKNDSGSAVQIWGRPEKKGGPYIIGDAPPGATFVSTESIKDASGARWYEINYNHRQAWVPERVAEIIDA